MSRLTAPPLFTAGQLIHQYQLNTLSGDLDQLCRITQGKPAASGLASKPLVKVILTRSQNVVSGDDGTTMIATWDAEVADTDNMFPGTGTDHLTVNTPGWYRIIAQAQWSSGAESERVVQILVNGVADPLKLRLPAEHHRDPPAPGHGLRAPGRRGDRLLRHLAKLRVDAAAPHERHLGHVHDGRLGRPLLAPEVAVPAMSAITQFVDGVMVDAAALNNLSTNIDALTQLTTGKTAASRVTSKPVLKLKRTAALSISNSTTPTQITWDTQLLDTDNMWASGQVITIQTAGWYRVDLQVTWASGSASPRHAPTNLAALTDERLGRSNPIAQQVRLYDRLDAGTTLRAGCLQTTSGSLALDPSVNYGGVWMSIAWDAPF
jgi:hypothetical protein